MSNSRGSPIDVAMTATRGRQLLWRARAMVVLAMFAQSFGCLVIDPAAASAQAPSANQSEFQALVAWIETQRPLDRRFTPKVPCRALFLIEVYEEVDQEELQRMKDLVARRNQSFDPLSAEIDRLEWLTKSPYIEQREAFIRDPNNWRVNVDLFWRLDERLIAKDDFFSDIARRDGWAFMYSPKELAVFDPRTGYPKTRNIDRQWGLAGGPFRYFSGGIPKAEGLQVNSSLSHLAHNGSFVIILDKPDGTAEFVYRIEGTWDSTNHRGYTSRITSFENAVPEGPPSMIWEISDWRFHDFLNMWLAHSVVEPLKSGSIIRTEYSLQEIEPLSMSDFESWTQLPSPIKPEPLRGTQPIRWVNDYRSSLEGVSLPADQEIPIHSISAVIGQAAAATTSTLSRWMWVAILTGSTTIVAAVLVFRSRTRHRS